VNIVRFKKLCRFCGSAARLAERLSLSAKSIQMRLALSFEGPVGADYSLVEIMSNTDRVFICVFLRSKSVTSCFPDKNFIATHVPLNPHYLELTCLQQFKIQNSKFKISQLAALPRCVNPRRKLLWL
jgi:hypothetical protein